MHDNRLVAALRAQGRDAVLVPLYTPLLTDETDVSIGRVFYGGINVYLQTAASFFRHTPWLLDRLFDSRPLLRAAGRRASATRPADLGALTVATLAGDDGPQRKELEKLVLGLRRLRPALVCLPNLMFLGLARRLTQDLSVPVLCELSGEDIFLDRLPEPHRGMAFRLIHERANDVAGFVALTEYYARHATAHFGLPAERVRQLPLGIVTTDFLPADPPPTPFTIGYLARVCPEKGLLNLARAFITLRRRGVACRLRAAGYLASADRAYIEHIHAELRAAGTSSADFQYLGTLTRPQKIAFLRSLHVLSVPTDYPEAKGLYILEALAAGVPVVQPEHGSFPELIAATGGGLLYTPRSPDELADALSRLAADPTLRRRLGEQGRAAVHERFTATRMAKEAWRLYERFVALYPGGGAGPHPGTQSPGTVP